MLFSYLLTGYGMALAVFARVWVAVRVSLLFIGVGVEAYDSLGLPLAASKPLEIDPHPTFPMDL